ncbi:GIY-YIG nuclease family protein [Kiritimatiella glycovorans]|uniref:GIY-YIG domain-containing protein n=1 Tax=Kiritimatiella glycovorans TaxID=1307763 RepID=A0A0G3EC69_9BACT|nr:GIY-YIG nuclease family protein [Kiritimatiella glycovorans]AKJ63878.1 hypothetical protein L21SP4_00609 [Kiritimatiella glycovorans]
MYFVYILYCPETGLSYVGHTSHLILRYYEHRDGMSRWTRRMRSPFLVYWEHFESRSEAMRREKYFKHGCGFRVRGEIIQRFTVEWM